MGKSMPMQPPAPHPAYGNGGHHSQERAQTQPRQKTVVERRNRHVPIMPRKPDQADE